MRARLGALVACLGAVGLLMGASAPARATTLASWTNMSPNGPYALPFTAGAAATTITFGGYNVPSSDDVTNIGLFLNGTGPNLLGSPWTFVPAPSGSDAATFSDGTSVPALVFAGVVAGSYDEFLQTIPTTIGSSYTLAFTYDGIGVFPNGFFADASNGTLSTVPLPAALPLFATGLVGLGLLGWRRKKKAIAA